MIASFIRRATMHRLAFYYLAGLLAMEGSTASSDG